MKLEDIIGKKIYCVSSTRRSISHDGTVGRILEENGIPYGCTFIETDTFNVNEVYDLKIWFLDYNLEGYKNSYNKNKIFLSESAALEYIKTLKKTKVHPVERFAAEMWRQL